jgi:hypothetical protein
MEGGSVMMGPPIEKPPPSQSPQSISPRPVAKSDRHFLLKSVEKLSTLLPIAESIELISNQLLKRSENEILLAKLFFKFIEFFAECGSDRLEQVLSLSHAPKLLIFRCWLSGFRWRSPTWSRRKFQLRSLHFYFVRMEHSLHASFQAARKWRKRRNQERT